MKIYAGEMEPKIVELNYCDECPFYRNDLTIYTPVCRHPNGTKCTVSVYAIPRQCPLRLQPILFKIEDRS
jgi:predicted nucleic acid-binding Zn finger protein